MSDARFRLVRLVANPRRDAGYTILEAMLPCVAFLVLGTLIAGGLWEPAAPSVVSGSPVSTAAGDSPDSMLMDPKSGNAAQKRPAPADAERRGVYITREYENRLIANPNRGGTASHGVPGSDFTGNGSNDILVTQPRATNLIDGTDPGGGYGTVEVWTLLSSGPVLALGSLNQNDLFGLSVKSAGDLDGDGAAELVIGAPLEHGDSGLEGAVYVHSGSDGQLLMVISGEEWEYFGRTVAGASDHDADGQWDIAASSWVYDHGQPKGMVSIHSGSDGALIRTYTSPLPDDGFGYEVVSLGDLDADADSELAIPATLAPGDPRAYAPATGRLYIFDGAVRAASPEHLSTSDAALTIMNPDPLIDHFGVLVELTKDEDSDGVPDLLVTSIVDPYSSAETTAMQIYSSASGDLLWPVNVGGTGSGRDGDQLPATDDDGNPILYSHYTSGLGVLADATRDLRVEQEDLMLVADAIGNDAAPGNPISGDVSLSGAVDLPDVNMVVTEIGNHSIVHDYVEDTGRLTGRWNALKPYQFGDYVLEVPGRVEPGGRGSGGGSGGGSPSDPVYPKPDPAFPGIGDQQWGGGVPGCDGYIRHPVCGIVPACFMNCCGADDCSGGDPMDNTDPGGGVGGPGDGNFNGIPDDEECGGSNPPAPTAECPDPCGDDDGDGIPNQYDCDSPECFDERYTPLGSDGMPCNPCGDDDGDGIPNQIDCDSACYDARFVPKDDQGNPLPCDPNCDDDGDGIPNKYDCDSECFEGDEEDCCDPNRGEGEECCPRLVWHEPSQELMVLGAQSTGEEHGYVTKISVNEEDGASNSEYSFTVVGPAYIINVSGNTATIRVDSHGFVDVFASPIDRRSRSCDPLVSTMHVYVFDVQNDNALFNKTENIRADQDMRCIVPINSQHHLSADMSSFGFTVKGPILTNASDWFNFRLITHFADTANPIADYKNEPGENWIDGKLGEHAQVEIPMELKRLDPNLSMPGGDSSPRRGFGVGTGKVTCLFIASDDSGKVAGPNDFVSAGVIEISLVPLASLFELDNGRLSPYLGEAEQNSLQAGHPQPDGYSIANYSPGSRSINGVGYLDMGTSCLWGADGRWDGYGRWTGTPEIDRWYQGLAGGSSLKPWNTHLPTVFGDSDSHLQFEMTSETPSRGVYMPSYLRYSCPECETMTDCNDLRLLNDEAWMLTLGHGIPVITSYDYTGEYAISSSPAWWEYNDPSSWIDGNVTYWQGIDGWAQGWAGAINEPSPALSSTQQFWLSVTVGTVAGVTTGGLGTGFAVALCSSLVGSGGTSALTNIYNWANAVTSHPLTTYVGVSKYHVVGCWEDQVAASDGSNPYATDYAGSSDGAWIIPSGTETEAAFDLIEDFLDNHSAKQRISCTIPLSRAVGTNPPVVSAGAAAATSFARFRLNAVISAVRRDQFHSQRTEQVPDSATRIFLESGEPVYAIRDIRFDSAP